MLGRKRKAPPDPLAHIDPWSAPPRFRPCVSDALDARRRYQELLDGLRAGAVHERLAGMLPQLEACVGTIWDTVQRAAELERVLATLDPERVTEDFKRARRSGADEQMVEALRERFASVQRLINTLDDLDERLRLLEARLGGLVARAAEVALAAGEGADDLDRDLQALGMELGTLQDGLRDLS